MVAAAAQRAGSGESRKFLAYDAWTLFMQHLSNFEAAMHNLAIADAY